MSGSPTFDTEKEILANLRIYNSAQALWAGGVKLCYSKMLLTLPYYAQNFPLLYYKNADHNSITTMKKTRTLFNST